MLLGLLLCMTACSKDNAPVEEQWEVTAILTPTGLGDLGYNDQMYLGLCYIREQLDCHVFEKFPENVDDGIGLAKTWMQTPVVEGKHRLLILCDENYKQAVRETGWKNTEDNCILQLECQENDLDIYTRRIPLFGACHVVGRMCSETLPDTSKHVAVVMANPQDFSINEGLEGFVEGAQEAGVKVDTYYLSQEQSLGYNLSQDLYHLCYQIAPRTGFLLPLAGGSNKGVYQYGRERHDDYIWTCALDADIAYTSYSASYGIMKYIDQLLLDFTRNWRNGQPNELHAICGLASGYIKVEVNPYIENSWGANFNEILQDAIECESNRMEDYQGRPW